MRSNPTPSKKKSSSYSCGLEDVEPKLAGQGTEISVGGSQGALVRGLPFEKAIDSAPRGHQACFWSRLLKTRWGCSISLLHEYILIGGLLGAGLGGRN